jgi:hypothetical protein
MKRMMRRRARMNNKLPIYNDQGVYQPDYWHDAHSRLSVEYARLEEENNELIKQNNLLMQAMASVVETADRTIHAFAQKVEEQRKIIELLGMQSGPQTIN